LNKNMNKISSRLQVLLKKHSLQVHYRSNVTPPKQRCILLQSVANIWSASKLPRQQNKHWISFLASSASKSLTMHRKPWRRSTEKGVYDINQPNTSGSQFIAQQAKQQNASNQVECNNESDFKWFK